VDADACRVVHSFLAVEESFQAVEGERRSSPVQCAVDTTFQAEPYREEAAEVYPYLAVVVPYLAVPYLAVVVPYLAVVVPYLAAGPFPVADAPYPGEAPYREGIDLDQTWPLCYTSSN
jgi:hypothetical protein